MQRSFQVDTYLVSCFYEGISRPRRLAQGLQQLGELLACERVSLRIWDRRGHWGCSTQAVCDAGRWALTIDESERPEPVLRALVSKFEPGQWKRLERLNSASTDGAGHARMPTALSADEIVFSNRMPLAQAEALLSLHRRGGVWPDLSSRLALASDACRALLPALDPIARLQQLSRQSSQLSAILNGLRMPMLLLDAGLRPLATNASARTLFHLSARTPAGKIAAALPGVPAARFAQLVERACARTAAGGMIEFAAADGSGVAHLLVLPVTVPAGVAQPAALVLVQSGGVSDQTHRLLQHVYHLTPAEARLAQLILDGQSPGRAASVLQVSLTTVRSQLSAVLKKTGAQRQSDLVRRLAPLLILSHLPRAD
jgi:DNA-binding CsgD family transcriptional regulator/PAS domain-containing protein